MQGRTRVQTRPYGGVPAPGVPQPIEDESSPRHLSTGGPLRAGDRVGRYIVRSKLGRGGMGVVYGAYDPALGRQVAIKLVRHRKKHQAELDVDERLRREAQALAQLSHPNVVSLYDVGSCEHGAYLALELVPGIDLDHWLHLRTREWKEIVEVFVQAGRGLAAAHTAGLVHRDVKPTNVIVGPHGHVTMVDFGLARSTGLTTTTGNASLQKELDAAGDGPEPPTIDDANEPADVRNFDPQAEAQRMLSKRLTGTDIIVGTRGYMSPEQLMGLNVGPRADQFSLCVALFEALYGVRPYPGKNAVETATSFARGELVEPADRRGVPLRLHRAIVRGLSIEPDDRFPSMDALLAEIRSSLPRRRTRLLLAAALVAVAAASASGGAWVHKMMTEPGATQDATLDARPHASEPVSSGDFTRSR